MTQVNGIAASALHAIQAKSATELLVDHLAAREGGRHLPKPLAQWMNTKLIVSGMSRKEPEIIPLGEVVLASAKKDITALEETTREHGYTLTGERLQNELASGPDPFALAIDFMS